MKEAIFLTQEYPFPPSGGGKLRDASLIRLLSEQARVEVLSFTENGDQPGTGSSPDVAGVTVTSVSRERRPLRERAVYPFRPYVLNGYSLNMENALRARAEAGKLLWISRLAMAKYAAPARRFGYRVLLDEHNVESDLFTRDTLRSPRHWLRLPLAWQCRGYEARHCREADAVAATSELDARRLRDLSGNPRIFVLPNSIDCESFERPKEARGTSVFFPGTLDYAPNEEGLLWFMDKVLPGLAARVPSLRLVVAGRNPPARLRAALERSGIAVHANPPSMAPYFEDAAVVFVPIVSGSGTRLKILEAMAAGIAVVSTTKGAEGLELEPGTDALIADHPDSFGDAIARLLEEPGLRERMAERARHFVRSQHDWRSLRLALDRMLRSLSERSGSRG